METLTTDVQTMDMLITFLLMFAVFTFAHVLNKLFTRWEDLHHARRMREIRRKFYETDDEWWRAVDRDERYIQIQTRVGKSKVVHPTELEEEG